MRHEWNTSGFFCSIADICHFLVHVRHIFLLILKYIILQVNPRYVSDTVDQKFSKFFDHDSEDIFV